MTLSHSQSEQITSVDHFLTDQERLAFAARQEAVIKTAEHYGLNPDNAILIGGGALAAAHGVDTSGLDFDLDVISIGDQAFGKRTMHNFWRSPPEVSTSKDPGAPLPLTRIRGLTADGFARNIFNYSSYDDMLKHVVTTESGLATLPVDRLIYSKVRGIDRRAKDEAGVLKAWVVGEATGHQLVDDPFWQGTITNIMKQTTEYPAPTDGERPEWLKALIKSDFDHPAFNRLRKRS